MNGGRARPRGTHSKTSRRCNKSGEQQGKGSISVTHDTEYFRRRAAEARAAACSKDEPERVEIAGELALAYAALARRRAAALAAAEDRSAIPLEPTAIIV
ncbi:MAG TPA: hypothetical protein VJR87_09390 [Allosphingosinicella sp.]|nr:hypothetical protein [Allosphingosinicella sp.]